MAYMNLTTSHTNAAVWATIKYDYMAYMDFTTSHTDAAVWATITYD